MKKLLLILLVVSLPALPLVAEAKPQQPTELAGLWVVRFNLATPDEIDRIIDTATSVGIQDLFAQVCGRAEAYYTSCILPPADGVPPGFDPLAYLIDRAHARGLRVHVWVNAFTAANRGSRPSSPEHIIYQHPEWVQVDKTGRSLLTYGPQEAPDVPAIFLDPGSPGVKEYLAEIVRELIANYVVDGVHLDYIRYPGPEFGYSAGSRSAFQALVGWDPAVAITSELSFKQKVWDLWRQYQVTQTVELIGRVIAEQPRRIIYSAAVVYDLERARNKYFQDWSAWLIEGKVDFVVPMAYFDRSDQLVPALHELKAKVGTTRVYPGIGAYKLQGKPNELLDQIQVVNRLGFSGMVFFEYRTMAEGNLFAALQ